MLLVGRIEVSSVSSFLLQLRVKMEMGLGSLGLGTTPKVEKR